jgi:hypothetical protein
MVLNMNGDGRMFADRSPWIEVCEQKSNKNPTNVGRKSNDDNVMEGAMDTTTLKSAHKLRSNGRCDVMAMAL